MDYIKQLIGSARYKLAPDTDFNYKIHLQNTTSPLKNNLNKIISELSAEEVFTTERENSTKYRILGRLNLITDNTIYYTTTTTNTNGTTQVNIFPSDQDWDFLLYVDNDQIRPKNWVLQLLYPYKIDPYTKVGDNQAFKGITIKNLTSIDPSGSREQVLIDTQQKNGLVEGDYCYIYSNTHSSNYTGFHTVESLGVEGFDVDNKIVLSTTYTNPPNGNKLTLKRAVNVSDDDINFKNPKIILSAVATDISGSTTASNPNYVKINTGNLSPSFSANTHNLRVSDYVEIRAPFGPNILNGLYRVSYIIDRYNFVIDYKLGNTPGFTPVLPSSLYSKPLFRRLNCVPSDYYTRKFKLLTSNDYDVNKATAFGNSIYPKIKLNELGVSNDTWLFTFTKDINTNGLYSHRGGNLTELYFATIKRAGVDSINWSDVTAHWDFDYSVATTATAIETVSKYNPSGKGTIEKNTVNYSEYFGDFVEFNRGEILEKTLSKIIHRFALNNNNTPEKGYYLDPFHKIYIRKFSNYIETALFNQRVLGIPGDAELRPNRSLEWRDILEPGYIEEGDNGVNYPFLNGANYIYFNKYVYLRRQIPDTVPEIAVQKTVDPKIKC